MSIKLTTQLSFPLQGANAVTVVLAPDNPNAQMQITILNVGFYGSLTLKRVINSVEYDVRGATNIAVQGAGTQVVFDYECPLDTVVTYRAYLDANSPIESAPSQITTDGMTFWLKDVVLGAFSTKVNIQSMSDVTRPANVLGTFKVLGRSNPILVTDVRQGRTGTMVITGRTTADNTALMSIIASGNTLLLQCPASAHFPDMYFQAGDISESWNGGMSTNQIHSWTIPFTETDPPSQSSITLDFNAWLLVTQWDSWANTLNDRKDWLEVFTTPFNDSDNESIGSTTTTFPTPFLQIGAFISTSQIGATDFNTALANWNTITGSVDVPATRAYNAQGDFSISTSLNQMIAAGKKICFTLRPDYATLNAAHLASMDAMLSTLKANGAILDVTLWHEPYFSGLSAVQYVAMVKYYGPTVRKYFPLWFVCSGNDANVSNGFYPGDDQVDGVAVDAYAASGTTQITNAQSIADAGSKAFGIWEFNGGADMGFTTAINGQTSTTITAHYQYISDLFAARLAAGKPNGACLLFSSGSGSTGSNNWLTSSPTANGGFEPGLGDWISGSATITQTAAQAHSGTNCAQITAPGGGGTANILMCSSSAGTIQAKAMPCVAGNTVAASGWFRSLVTPRSCRIDISYYDASGSLLSTTTGGTITSSTSAWTSVTTSATAPASTAFARIQPTVQSTAASEVHYFDDPQLCTLPNTNDLTSAIQYPWDYRIALLSTMKSTLGA